MQQTLLLRVVWFELNFEPANHSKQSMVILIEITIGTLCLHSFNWKWIHRSGSRRHKSAPSSEFVRSKFSIESMFEHCALPTTIEEGTAHASIHSVACLVNSIVDRVTSRDRRFCTSVVDYFTYNPLDRDTRHLCLRALGTFRGLYGVHAECGNRSSGVSSILCNLVNKFKC
jgi:hypothetical protein